MKEGWSDAGDGDVEMTNPTKEGECGDGDGLGEVVRSMLFD